MNTYTLVVKTDTDWDQWAAPLIVWQHITDFACCEQTGQTRSDVTLRVTVETNAVARLNQWMAESRMAPFPPGSLLFWTPQEVRQRCGSRR